MVDLHEQRNSIQRCNVSTWFCIGRGTHLYTYSNTRRTYTRTHTHMHMHTHTCKHIVLLNGTSTCCCYTVQLQDTNRTDLFAVAVWSDSKVASTRVQFRENARCFVLTCNGWKHIRQRQQKQTLWCMKRTLWVLMDPVLTNTHFTLTHYQMHANMPSRCMCE